MRFTARPWQGSPGLGLRSSAFRAAVMALRAVILGPWPTDRLPDPLVEAPEGNNSSTVRLDLTRLTFFMVPHM